MVDKVTMPVPDVNKKCSVIPKINKMGRLYPVRQFPEKKSKSLCAVLNIV